jgi:hypothetical protein
VVKFQLTVGPQPPSLQGGGPTPHARLMEKVRPFPWAFSMGLIEIRQQPQDI